MSTTAPIPELRSQENPPLWRDVRVVKWGSQVIVLVAVVMAAIYLYSNVINNLEDGGLPTGFGFMSGKFGSAIPGITDSADFRVWEAFRAGFINTLRVIIFGIPGCTLLGIVIGIFRLSNNLAVRTIGTLYVETFRNIPALVWIYLVHFALAVPSLPQITDEVTPLGLFVVSNRGIGVPWFNPDATTTIFGTFSIPVVFTICLLLGLVAAWAATRWRAQVNARTGEQAHGGRYALGAFLLFVVIGHFAGSSALALDTPFIDGRQVGGGLTVQIPYFSVTVALTLYTASHVAEIVRGAILSIHKGQSEAAYAIALTNFQRYRFIILPQAFRIMIPPLANQYLNITKNSSLAVAFGYIEIASIFSRIVNNATPAVQGVVILMAMYLIFSLSISAVANYFNRRMALVTR